MKCHEIRNQMSDYIDGILTLEEREKFEKHLIDCESCSMELEDIKYISEMMKAEELKPLPNDFKSELHEKLKKESNGQKSGSGLSFWKWPRLAPLVAVAATLVFALVIFNPLGQSNPLMSSKDMYDSYGFEDAGPVVSEAFGEPMSLDNRSLSSEDFPDQTESVAIERATVQAHEKSYRTDRLIIQNVNLSIKVETFDEVIQNLYALSEEHQGFIENVNIYEVNNGLRRGQVVMRIPQELLNPSLALIHSYGDLVYETRTAQDITQMYRETADRIENLKITEQRYRELIAKAENIQDLLLLENELTRIRGEISRFDQQINRWEHLADLSTVSVEVIEVENIKPTLEPLNKNIFQESYEGFVETINSLSSALQRLIVFALSKSPYFLLLTLFTFVAYRVIKKIFIKKES